MSPLLVGRSREPSVKLALPTRKLCTASPHRRRLFDWLLRSYFFAPSWQRECRTQAMRLPGSYLQAASLPQTLARQRYGLQKSACRLAPNRQQAARKLRRRRPPVVLLARSTLSLGCTHAQQRHPPMTSARLPMCQCATHAFRQVGCHLPLDARRAPSKLSNLAQKPSALSRCDAAGDSATPHAQRVCGRPSSSERRDSLVFACANALTLHH